eukprot:TRINITY_DN5380_c1_g1_i1.p1 TRINITY_DN5380_c1_g1~~TRINITY_DN5380_c1_g1_i1.p1  ORF type:complete len:1812 (+),score=596.21 TRINITY_DN5380_c1_g1_i1:346-5781(+)
MNTQTGYLSSGYNPYVTEDALEKLPLGLIQPVSSNYSEASETGSVRNGRAGSAIDEKDMLERLNSISNPTSVLFRKPLAAPPNQSGSPIGGPSPTHRHVTPVRSKKTGVISFNNVDAETRVMQELQQEEAAWEKQTSVGLRPRVYSTHTGPGMSFASMREADHRPSISEAPPPPPHPTQTGMAAAAGFSNTPTSAPLAAAPLAINPVTEEAKTQPFAVPAKNEVRDISDVDERVEALIKEVAGFKKLGHELVPISVAQDLYEAYQYQHQELKFRMHTLREGEQQREILLNDIEVLKKQLDNVMRGLDRNNELTLEEAIRDQENLKQKIEGLEEDVAMSKENEVKTANVLAVCEEALRTSKENNLQLDRDRKQLMTMMEKKDEELEQLNDLVIETRKSMQAAQVAGADLISEKQQEIDHQKQANKLAENKSLMLLARVECNEELIADLKKQVTHLESTITDRDNTLHAMRNEMTDIQMHESSRESELQRAEVERTTSLETMKRKYRLLRQRTADVLSRHATGNVLNWKYMAWRLWARMRTSDKIVDDKIQHFDMDLRAAWDKQEAALAAADTATTQANNLRTQAAADTERMTQTIEKKKQELIDKIKALEEEVVSVKAAGAENVENETKTLREVLAQKNQQVSELQNWAEEKMSQAAKDSSGLFTECQELKMKLIKRTDEVHNLEKKQITSLDESERMLIENTELLDWKGLLDAWKHIQDQVYWNSQLKRVETDMSEQLEKHVTEEEYRIKRQESIIRRKQDDAVEQLKRKESLLMRETRLSQQEQLLEMDRLKAAKELLVKQNEDAITATTQRLQATIDMIESNRLEETEKLGKQIAVLEEELQALNEKLEATKETESKLNQAEEDLAALRTDMTEAHPKLERLVIAEDELANTRTRAEELMALVEELSPKANQLETVEQEKQQLDEEVKRLELVTKELSATLSEVEPKASLLPAVEEQLKDTTQQLHIVTTSLDEAQSELKEATAGLLETREKLALAEPKADRLTLVEEELTNTVATLDKANTELTDARPKATRLPMVEEELAKVKSELAKTTADVETASEELAELRPKAERLIAAEADLDKTASVLEKANGELATLRPKAERLPVVEKELDTERSALSECKTKLQEANSKVQMLEPKAARLKIVETEHQQLTAKHAQQETELEQLKEQHTEVQAVAGKVPLLEKRMAKLSEDLDSCRTEITDLTLENLELKPLAERLPKVQQVCEDRGRQLEAIKHERAELAEANATLQSDLDEATEATTKAKNNYSNLVLKMKQGSNSREKRGQAFNKVFNLFNQTELLRGRYFELLKANVKLQKMRKLKMKIAQALQSKTETALISGACVAWVRWLHEDKVARLTLDLTVAKKNDHHNSKKLANCRAQRAVQSMDKARSTHATVLERFFMKWQTYSKERVVRRNRNEEVTKLQDSARKTEVTLSNQLEQERASLTAQLREQSAANQRMQEGHVQLVQNLQEDFANQRATLRQQHDKQTTELNNAMHEQQRSYEQALEGARKEAERREQEIQFKAQLSDIKEEQTGKLLEEQKKLLLLEQEGKLRILEEQHTAKCKALEAEHEKMKQEWKGLAKDLEGKHIVALRSEQIGVEGRLKLAKQEADAAMVAVKEMKENKKNTRQQRAWTVMKDLHNFTQQMMTRKYWDALVAACANRQRDSEVNIALHTLSSIVGYSPSLNESVCAVKQVVEGMQAAAVAHHNGKFQLDDCLAKLDEAKQEAEHCQQEVRALEEELSKQKLEIGWKNRRLKLLQDTVEGTQLMEEQTRARVKEMERTSKIAEEKLKSLKKTPLRSAVPRKW